MNRLEGLEEPFRKAKVVFMTAFSDGKETTRQMTNFNEDTYKTIWLPTERNTKKVKHIEADSRAILTFPAEEKGKFFEIEGDASFEDKSVVAAKWQWWWLYWHPAQRDRFWFPPSEDQRRIIINIEPKTSSLKIIIFFFLMYVHYCD